MPADHDTHNRFKALELAMEMEKPYVGLFYEEQRTTMDQAAHQLVQQAKEFDINRHMARYT
jgi:2-oxoglutarate/2-oxoacid ferredoxin oxidoreductase subunit beta